MLGIDSNNVKDNNKDDANNKTHLQMISYIKRFIGSSTTTTGCDNNFFGRGEMNGTSYVYWICQHQFYNENSKCNGS